MHEEHVKEWLRGIQREEDPEQNGGNHSAGDSWRLLMRLVIPVWETGRVPKQLGWIIIVLISKGGGNYRRISLLEPI
jgi:hypothetical protein